MMSSGLCFSIASAEIVLEAEPVAVDDALLQPLLDRLGALLLRRLRGDAVLEQRDEGLQRVVALAPAVEDQILGGAHLLLGDLVQRHDLRDMDDGAGQAALAAHGRGTPN